MRTVVTMAVGGLIAAGAAAQQPVPQVMGTVATQDALVTGGLEVQGSQARLVSNASVTAYDRTASIALDRGGEVLVCATSEFHLLHSGAGKSLLFGLDRGAFELHTASEAQDVILTPDIRFSVEAQGSYDLRLRVTRNGDTCVENAGVHSPVLILNEAFSQASYRLMPGQHVLFEHGSLLEVVDNERSACGCPPPTLPVVVAANGTPAEKASAAHPFPAAASEGLTAASSSAPPADEPQISATLHYGEGSDISATPAATPAPAVAVTPVSTTPPRTPPGAHAILHKIGSFFHRLFHPQS